MMETQWARRIAGLEQQLAEAQAESCGLRLALREAEKQIEELTQPQDEGKKGKEGKRG